MIPLFQSVKFRLTLWYAFMLTVLLSVFSFFMHAELARVLYKDANEKLHFEATSIESSLKAQMQDFLQDLSKKPAARPWVLSPEDTLRFQQRIQEWEKKTRKVSRSTFAIRLEGLDHSVLLSNLSGWESEVIYPDFERDSVFMETGRSHQTIHFQGKPIRLYYHLVKVNNRPLFIIQLGMSLTAVQSALHGLAVIILISIPGAVAAACIAGWFLTKRSFRPIDSMIREARQITAAYLKGRLPRTQAGDELDRLAETLNEMMDRIENSTRAIQDFSSDISHELRTPLAIIRGEVELALRRARSPEVLVQTLRVVEEEVNELIRLVDDLMLLVRSDAQQLKFQKKPVSLKSILGSVFERFQERAHRKDIRFTAAIENDVLVDGDELYLKRLFSNLTDNALKFTPDKGNVDLRLIKRDGKAVIEVSDTGMGIELEVQSKVFSRFYRTDQARSHEGSGLGLNIAKAICEGHQGQIKIQSSPGQGTLVRVEIPSIDSH